MSVFCMSTWIPLSQRDLRIAPFHVGDLSRLAYFMQIPQYNQWSSIVIAKNNLKSFLLLKDTMAKIQQPPVLPTNRETKQ